MYKRISALCFVLLLGSSCTLTMDAWDGEASYTNHVQSEALADDEALDARVTLNVGSLEVEPASKDQIYEVDLYFNELTFKPDIQFSRDQGKARLVVGLEGEGRSFSRMGDNVMNVRLNPDIPVDLETTTGVGESRLSLSGMMIRSLRLESGVGETEVAVLEPNRTDCRKVELTSGVGALEVVGIGNFGFEEFTFRGGVGGSKLDFTGDWNRIGDVEIEVGVGGVEILVPRTLGLEVRVSKGLFSNVELPDFKKEGDTYYSENIKEVTKVVKFRVRSGIGGVGFRWL
ncbi:MAG: hypothetical protein JSU96_09865 [Acidobacteriota bacterium]|nr:MAG: hypothetical protein JSU96_09865 [Acidobacteriota bacterium]